MAKYRSDNLRHLLRISRAISDENRIRALMMLHEGELCLCQIIEMLGLAPSTVSKHMSVLADAGLVSQRKAGRWMYYSLPGDDADQAIRHALELLRGALEGDDTISQDARKLSQVMRCEPSEFAKHYRK